MTKLEVLWFHFHPANEKIKENVFSHVGHNVKTAPSAIKKEADFILLCKRVEKTNKQQQQKTQKRW